MLARFWTMNSVKYENIIGAMKRNISDFELWKDNRKVGKENFRFHYLFKITKYCDKC